MGRGRNKNKNKKKAKPRKLTGREKAQQMAKRNIAKYGGTASAAAANKASNQAKAKTKSIAKGTTGIGPVKSGSAYSKAVSTAKNQPTKKTSGIGPYADGAKYAAALKASPPKFTPATKVASIGQQGPASNIKYFKDANEGKGGFMIDTGAGRPGQVRLKTPIAAAGDVTGLGIGDARATTGFTPSVPGLAESLGIDSKTGLDSEGRGPSYLSTKSAESFGAPSQAETDAAAGITAGGLNIGGSGFTPTNQSGGSTSRAIRDMTSEQLADRYEASLDPNSFKGLSDGSTFGVGPVASGDAYARGLNVAPFGSVENTMRSIVGRIPLVNRIPGVNTRLLTDKEIADKRIKASNFRKANLVGRGGGGGGARLPVAPLTPEEILLPEEMAAPVYQQVAGQTGVDPNRLMQIQQDAYLQAFNPSYNPMFRFFNRGMRRGAFRKAFRRD